MKKSTAFRHVVLCNLLLSSIATAGNFPETTRYFSKMFSAIETEKAIISTKLLAFDIDNAHNSSIMEEDGGYLLVFRYEHNVKLCNECGLSKNEIKMVHLDKSFNPKSPIQTITPKPSFDPEDPRLHKLNGELYITYNDEPSPHIHSKKNPNSLLKRRLFVGKLDVATATLSDVKVVPSGGLTLANIEKNWIPFSYPETAGDLHYIYMTFPYKIIKVAYVEGKCKDHLYTTKSQRVYSIWEREVWGPIRGGTPARLVDDVYLTFFHAWRPCPDGKNYYYVMGAYTFEAKPPFKILKITPQPILFKEAYSARHRAECVHTVYPSGFAIEKIGEKTVLHVSCGENDTSTRIVSIDKDILLQEMVTVPYNV